VDVTVHFSRDSVRFPRTGHIWVPRSSARAAAAGLSMHSPCVPWKVLGQRALYAAVRLGGSRILPGARASWDDPVEPAVFADFAGQWREAFGSWDSAALYSRPQSARAGCALLLLRDGRGVGFVRITADGAKAAHEFAVMSGVHAARPSTFKIARPIGWGAGTHWAWVGTQSVPNYPLGAVRRLRLRLAVTEEIDAILDDVLPRGAHTPLHWRGSHGDLAPWNLRTGLSGVVRVIDWEDAGFAPPGVDILYGGLTSALTFGTSMPSETSGEAADWVERMLTGRLAVGEAPDSVNHRLLMALARVPKTRSHCQ
jgi:hypothetical protein